MRLKEYKKEYDKLNTPEIEKYFAQVDEIKKKVDFLTEIKTVYEEVLKNVQELKTVDLTEIGEKYSELEEWIVEMLEKRVGVRELNDLLMKSVSSLEGKVNGILKIIKQEVETLNSKKAKATQDIQLSIETEDTITANLRNNAKKRYEETQRIFNEYLKDLKKMDGLIVDREAIITSIKETNKLVFATREEQKEKIREKIQLVQDEAFAITLQLNQAGDRTAFKKAIDENKYDLEFYGQWRRKRLPDVLSSKVNPFEFAEAVMNNKPGDLRHSIALEGNGVSEEYEIDDEYANRLIANNTPIEDIAELNTKKYHKEKLLKILKLEEIPFDDEFFVELAGKPIQYCSPGQRCSAMLPIVTLTSSAPIIIDQPEDNLDNRLVSRAIFKILAKLKETRQIIVATHNPNILVSGDAEQVIVLGNDGSVENYGAIDEPSIVKNVIDLMEGGREAFKKRRKKYSPFLD